MLTSVLAYVWSFVVLASVLTPRCPSSYHELHAPSRSPAHRFRSAPEHWTWLYHLALSEHYGFWSVGSGVYFISSRSQTCRMHVIGCIRCQQGVSQSYVPSAEGRRQTLRELSDCPPSLCACAATLRDCTRGRIDIWEDVGGYVAKSCATGRDGSRPADCRESFDGSVSTLGPSSNCTANQRYMP